MCNVLHTIGSHGRYCTFLYHFTQRDNEKTFAAEEKDLTTQRKFRKMCTSSSRVYRAITLLKTSFSDHGVRQYSFLYAMIFRFVATHSLGSHCICCKNVQTHSASQKKKGELCLCCESPHLRASSISSNKLIKHLTFYFFTLFGTQT